MRRPRIELRVLRGLSDGLGSRGARTTLVGATLLLAAGCWRAAPVPSPSAGLALQQDLAELAWIAEREAPNELALFGTPAAQPYQDVGFLAAERAPGANPSAWARRRAEIFFVLNETGPRVALLDLEPAAGLEQQSLSAWLNDTPLTTRTLAPGRQRYRLDLPEAAQRRNSRLKLLFGQRAARDESGPQRHAARVHGFMLARPDDPAVAALLAPDSPAPLSVERQGGLPRIVQVGAGALRFAFALPAQAELRVKPELVRGPGVERATFRVTLEAEGGARTTLWQAELKGASRELSLPLPGQPGTLIRLGLEVEVPAGAPQAAWIAPRLLGRGEPHPLLDPGPATAAEEGRATPLRMALAQQQVNVLLVILDAARARNFGAYGYGRATTPELDRLASEGVLFERAYTPAAFTLSAMASLWTSRYPDEHHAGVAHDAPLPADRPTLAERLAAAGIATVGLIGNSMAGPAFGLERGFAEFDEVHLKKGPRAAALAEAFEAWLQRRPQDRRFFAYVHFREPHFPYDPLPPWSTLFGPDAPLDQRARSDPGWYGSVNDGERDLSKSELSHLVRLYDGNLAYADRQLGALRQALERKGLWERTLVIVAADHGEGLWEHSWLGHNQQVFEESTHVPLVLRLPGTSAPRGTRLSTLVDLLDVAPTIADALGLGVAVRRTFAGRSLLPVALGAPGKPATFAITTGELRGFGLRHERFKYVRNVRYGVEQLYDLERDPAERTSAKEQYPVRLAYYRQELQRRVLRTLGGTPRESQKPRLTPEQLENLRSLGYVQ